MMGVARLVAGLGLTLFNNRIREHRGVVKWRSTIRDRKDGQWRHW